MSDSHDSLQNGEAGRWDSPQRRPPDRGDGPSSESAYAGFEREDLLRYARHFVLPHVGPEGQRALADAKVLLVGAGGLGSPVAMYLAAAGVGTLGIVDPDLVDLSNLQRQILHGISFLGQFKVDSAQARSSELNPNVEVVPYRTRLSSANALEILDSYDLVVDGSDNFPTRYLVNDACVRLGIPFVYGAVDRWEGQVSVFGAPGGPCYRCLFREPPPPGLIPTCAEAGVLGVLPGIMGSIQAAEAVKLILGAGTSLAGRLLIFDALELSFREVRLRANPECSVCSRERSQVELVDYDLFCGVSEEIDHSALTPISLITPTELEGRLGDEAGPLLLDVREPFEWEIGNLQGVGAVHIPYAQVQDRAGELPGDRPIVVYCRLGVRGAVVAQQLMALGFSDVHNLKGGYLAWATEVDPALTRY